MNCFNPNERAIMKKNKIKILVVDDDAEELIELMMIGLDDYEFVAESTFNINKVKNKLVENQDITIILLDIYDKENNPAGLILLQSLNKDPSWKASQKENAVCIVVATGFSHGKEEKHSDFSILKDPYLAGFLTKKHLSGSDLAKEEEVRLAVSTLEKAHSKACEFRVDSVQNVIGYDVIELLCSPNSHNMIDLKAQMIMAAKFDFPVLIHGETGTGKELVARGIYKLSQLEENKVNGDYGYKFVSTNIAALHKETQYSTLFGHARGSFTGAGGERVGLFQQAMNSAKEGGVVFLDEIADASEETQTMLLRVLQEKTIMKLGGKEEEKVNFKLISASHKSLPAQVASGMFRDDLYQRIKVLELFIPPLRKRQDDIPVLVYKFLNDLNVKYKKNVKISKENEECIFSLLLEYNWPGNVRELESAISRAYAYTKGNELNITEAFMQEFTNTNVFEESSNNLSKNLLEYYDKFGCVESNYSENYLKENLVFSLSDFAIVILNDLEKNPCPITDIKNIFGKLITTAVLTEYIKRYKQIQKRHVFWFCEPRNDDETKIISILRNPKTTGSEKDVIYETSSIFNSMHSRVKGKGGFSKYVKIKEI